MEGVNGHPFSHVEAVCVTSLYPGIEIQDGAASLPGAFHQVGEQPGANALATVSRGGGEVIDIDIPVTTSERGAHAGICEAPHLEVIPPGSPISLT